MIETGFMNLLVSIAALGYLIKNFDLSEVCVIIWLLVIVHIILRD